MLPVKRVTLKGVLPHYPGSRPPHLRHLPSSLKLPPSAPTDPAPVQEEDELERVALLST